MHHRGVPILKKVQIFLPPLIFSLLLFKSRVQSLATIGWYCIKIILGEKRWTTVLYLSYVFDKTNFYGGDTNEIQGFSELSHVNKTKKKKKKNKKNKHQCTSAMIFSLKIFLRFWQTNTETPTIIFEKNWIFSWKLSFFTFTAHSYKWFSGRSNIIRSPNLAPDF